MELRLNGRAVSVHGAAAHTTLLDYLRSQGLTAAKEGCAEGECGACAVLLVSPAATGSQLRAVNSCLMPLAAAAGQEIYTVESLAGPAELAPPQQAIAAAGGSQCGYCTPGFVAALAADYYRPTRTGPCDPHAMGGNLCRCTGYRPLRDAALSLDGAPAPCELTGRLTQPAPALAAYNQLGFARPATLDDCRKLLAEHPEARLIAGATDLGVEANLRGRRWPLLVSVEALPELRIFRETPAAIEIGAALPLTDLEEKWTAAPPYVKAWFDLFASPLIRNRATLGGNLATASPVGDSAPLLLALDAELDLPGRTVPLAAFFTGYRQTQLQPGELIEAIRIPKPLPDLAAFYKVAKRAQDDISTVAAAFALRLDPAGRITAARIAYGGVAATPIRAEAAERALTARPWNAAAVRAAQAAIAATLTPLSDHRGSAAYRLAIAQSLLEKFLWETRQEAAA